MKDRIKTSFSYAIGMICGVSVFGLIFHQYKEAIAFIVGVLFGCFLIFIVELIICKFNLNRIIKKPKAVK